MNSITSDSQPVQLLLARDCLAGELAIKAKGETYLPRLDSQTDAEYSAYVNRASFYPAAAQTLEDCLAAAFRRSPEINLAPAGPLQPQLESFLADADLGGTPFLAHALAVLREVLSVGRAGTLIQWDQTRARPWLTLYKSEQILEHHVERVDGRLTLTRLLLQDPDGTQRSFSHTSTEYSAAPVLSPDPIPLITPIPPITPIRFVLHTANDSTRSPLADIITCNLDHYRLSADYRHGLHLAALPTAWVSGFDKSTALRIGSSQAWVTEAPGATAGFLEFRGTGLSHIERALERTEAQIQALANRLLGRTDTGEPTEAGLATCLDSVAQSLSRVLQHAHTLYSSSGEAPISPITPTIPITFRFADISTPQLKGPDLTAVVEAWKSGAISRETLLDCLKRGQLLPDGRTVKDEKQLLYRTV